MGRTKRSNEIPALYYYVGRRIQQYREMCDMTQDELAQKIGIGRTSIVNFEDGKQRIPLEDIYRMALVFGCKAGDILPEVSTVSLMSREQAFVEFLKQGKQE